MKALVLCGGHGTRLGDLTRDRPKPLLPIDGEPLLGWTLALLAREGFGEVAINVHVHATQISDYVGDGRRFGVHATLFHEPELRGTAGTVRALEGFFGSDDALVLYGDLLLDIDLRAVHAAHAAKDADATLVLHRRARSNSAVTMADDRRITSFVERPADPSAVAAEVWVNSAVAFLGRAARAAIPAQVPCDLPRDVYAPNVDALRLFGYPLAGYRCAIDSAARYEEACRAAREGLVRTRVR